MKKKAHLLLGILLLLTTAGAVVLMLALLAEWLGRLNPNVSAALITASVGLVGLWYAQWHARTREISENHRQSKIEVYNAFFDIVEKFQGEYANADFQSKEELPEQLRRDFQKLNRGLIVWASPQVIKAWMKFREASGSGTTNVLISVDNMYRAIRKDLGNSNFGLETGDLIKSVVSDPENWGK